MPPDQLAQFPLSEPAINASLPQASRTEKSWREVWVSLLGIAIVASAGIGLGCWIAGQQLGQAAPNQWYNVFYVLFSRNEPTGLGLALAFTGMTALWLAGGAPVIARPLRFRPGFAIIVLALLSFALGVLGNDLVFHHYALTADENMADFQARIFLSGRLRAVIPPFWEPMIRLIMPTHAGYFPALHSWNSSYLPVYAAMRAPFMSIGLESLLNPLCAGLSVVLIAAITRKLWPDDAWKPVIAAALLASSAQFLVMSMTAYAMPVHLALNLLWLWLYLEPARKRFWLAPFVGVAALALHQPFFHALFVAPFLLRLVRDRRWKASFFFAIVYGLGIAGCLLWWHYFLPHFDAASSKSAFAVHRYTLLIQCIYLLLLMGWLAFPIPLLAVLGFAGIRRASPFLRDAALSCLLTFGFYLFVRYDQAHGWGDRYFHGTLGCLILVAVAGWQSLREKIGRSKAAALVVAGVIAAFLVQLPLRCFQAEDFVYPYAHAREEFEAAGVDLVGFNPLLAWYSADLTRNDPLFQERPITVSFFSMTMAEVKLLQKSFPRRKIFTEIDLKRFGLVTKEPK